MKIDKNNRIFYYGKDGGYESTVWGYWLCEFKKLFSIVLLRFENGTREAYHNHAFGCISWLLTGELIEHHKDGQLEVHRPSLWPIVTKRSTYHKVYSVGRTWVVSFRGSWRDNWQESVDGRDHTLTNGRVEV